MIILYTADEHAHFTLYILSLSNISFHENVKADRVLATCIFIGIASPIMGKRIKLALLLKEGDLYFMKYCIKYNYELRGIYAAHRQGFTC